MSTLVTIVYDDQYRAGEVLSTLQRLQNEFLIDLEDAAYVTKNDKGKIKLHQTQNLTAGGAIGGSFWGFLIGLLFFAPFAGAAIGAGLGALSGKASDYGIDDKYMKSLSESLHDDSSAIFVLVKNAVPDKVIPEISKFGGKVIQTSLSKDAEQKLQAALDENLASQS